MLDKVLNTIDSRRHQAVDSLTHFLNIPSVSTKPDHKPDMQRCAQWLVDQLSFGGLEVKVMPTAGHPAVVAKNKHVAGRATVLYYGHYDVQPPEPLEQWKTPPFEPDVRDGAIYARGAADDKGQVWCHVESILAWQAHGGLPVNLTLLVEGEEEIGSPNLESFVTRHADWMKCDIAVVSDTNQFAKGIPAITYGLRGLVYMEVTVRGPSHDLHSGMFGGSVPNPANILCEVLGSLHDEHGRVAVEGFYDDVLPLSSEEREMWAKLPFDDTSSRAQLGLGQWHGEEGFSPLERRWARPTCDINGLTSGYQGPGAKTVIPAVASAKVSMRLVPNQDPSKIVAGFEKTIRSRCPASVSVEVNCHSHTPPVLVPREGEAIRLASEALELGFGKQPTLIREGGSIPVVGLFRRVLNVDTLLIGYGLPDDRVHSPNEKFELDSLYNGARTSAVLYEKLSMLRGG